MGTGQLGYRCGDAKSDGHKRDDASMPTHLRLTKNDDKSFMDLNRSSSGEMKSTFDDFKPNVEPSAISSAVTKTDVAVDTDHDSTIDAGDEPLNLQVSGS